MKTNSVIYRKNEFINEKNGRNKRLPSTITFDKLILNNAEVESFIDNYKTFVRFKVPVRKENNRAFVKFDIEHIEVGDVRYVVKLINLRHSLPRKWFDNFSPIEELLCFQGRQLRGMGNYEPRLNQRLFANNNFSLSKMSEQEESCNKIADWCRRNGFPFSFEQCIKHKMNSFNKTAGAYEIKKRLIDTKEIVIGFDLWDFILQLHIFYCTYSMFRKIRGDEPFDSLFKNYSIAKCEQILERIYYNIDVKAILNFKNKKEITRDNVISFKPSTVFDLALYTLFVFETFCDGEFKECPICHEYFLPEKYNQVYCNTRPCEVSGNHCEERNCSECTRRTCYPQLMYKHNRKKTTKKARE